MTESVSDGSLSISLSLCSVCVCVTVTSFGNSAPQLPVVLVSPEKSHDAPPVGKAMIDVSIVIAVNRTRAQEPPGEQVAGEVYCRNHHIIYRRPILVPVAVADDAPSAEMARHGCPGVQEQEPPLHSTCGGA